MLLFEIVPLYVTDAVPPLRFTPVPLPAKLPPLMVNVPLIVVREIPFVPLVDETETNVAASVPVLNKSACPVPEMETSDAFKVPKLVPAIPADAASFGLSPILKPLMV